MEHELSRILDEANFFSIADGNIWEIEGDYDSLLAEAEKMIDSSISHLSSISEKEMNLIFKKHIQKLYAGIFHFIVQNRIASEELDPSGNFKWAPVKKKLGAMKAELRMLKEYMEIHMRKNQGLRFSLNNVVVNLEEAARNVNHVLVTHANMAKL